MRPAMRIRAAPITRLETARLRPKSRRSPFTSRRSQPARREVGERVGDRRSRDATRQQAQSPEEDTGPEVEHEDVPAIERDVDRGEDEARGAHGNERSGPLFYRFE